MTRKNFIALADWLKKPAGYCEPFTQRQVGFIADFCKSQNSNFNKEIFMGYVAGFCDPHGGKV